MLLVRGVTTGRGERSGSLTERASSYFPQHNFHMDRVGLNPSSVASRRPSACPMALSSSTINQDKFKQICHCNLSMDTHAHAHLAEGGQQDIQLCGIVLFLYRTEGNGRTLIYTRLR
jgi:hypothetical protein